MIDIPQYSFKNSKLSIDIDAYSDERPLIGSKMNFMNKTETKFRTKD